MDLVHPDDREATRLAVARLRDQQPVLGFENRYRCHDGSYRWLEWRSSPQGELVYAAARDITQRKEAERSLAREQMFTKAVLDSVPGLLYVYDDRGRLVRWNSQHETMTGYSAEELAGMTALRLVPRPPGGGRAHCRRVARIPSRGTRKRRPCLSRSRGSASRSTSRPSTCAWTSATTSSAIGIDVTERRRAEAESAGERGAVCAWPWPALARGSTTSTSRRARRSSVPSTSSMLGYERGRGRRRAPRGGSRRSTPTT